MLQKYQNSPRLEKEKKKRAVRAGVWCQSIRHSSEMEAAVMKGGVSISTQDRGQAGCVRIPPLLLHEIKAASGIWPNAEP